MLSATKEYCNFWFSFSVFNIVFSSKFVFFSRLCVLTHESQIGTAIWKQIFSLSHERRKSMDMNCNLLLLSDDGIEGTEKIVILV
ncbi:hypothetical protein ACOSQ2_018834 [Xanthoceras sorbifolium]